MFEPLQLRDQPVPERIVVVRLGVTTMADERLTEACQRCHQRWGIWGFSVLEVPDGDNFSLLARMRPELTLRRQLLVADGATLVNNGFPLLSTLTYPHWTVQLAQPDGATFARVRICFSGPVDNPAFDG